MEPARDPEDGVKPGNVLLRLPGRGGAYVVRYDTGAEATGITVSRDMGVVYVWLLPDGKAKNRTRRWKDLAYFGRLSDALAWYVETRLLELLAEDPRKTVVATMEAVEAVRRDVLRAYSPGS